MISQIKEAGCRAGVALNPADSCFCAGTYSGQVDMVLIMTVNPGFGGQEVHPLYHRKGKSSEKAL